MSDLSSIQSPVFRLQCNACKQEKICTDFPRKSESPTGYAPRCKACTNERRKRYRTGLLEDLEIPLEIRRITYKNIILKMYKEGIASEQFCKEALERIS